MGMVVAQLDEAVREAGLAKARCRAILDSSDDAIIDRALDGTITGWNVGAERLYGYSAAEVIGRSMGAIIPPNLGTELSDSLAKLKRGERIERHETERIRKDGSRAQVAVCISPVWDSGDRIAGATSVERDITARKRAEDTQRFLAEATTALSASLDYERTLDRIARLAVPSLADVCIVDMIEDQSVRQRSTAQAGAAYDECLRLIQTRYSLDPDVPHPVWEVLSTGEPSLVGDLSNPRSNPAHAGADLVHSLYDLGVQSWMAVPLTIRGRPAGAISFMSVDSRRCYTEEDLALAEELAARAAVAVDNARLYRDARNAVTARDEFLSVAAHELRTPMTSLRGFVQLALRQLDRDGTMDPTQLRQALTVINQQSRKLSNLISQLLDVSRLEVKRLSLEPRVVDLGKVVESVVGAALATNTDHAIMLRIPMTVLALVDPLRMEQVVTNLLDNAIRYSPPGSRIDVEVAQLSREIVQVGVRDHGPGIPVDLRERIFTRFNQMQNPEHIGGMGLGLYISREIVQLHGGKIEVEFPGDEGTRFVVTLPSGLGEAEAPSEM